MMLRWSSRTGRDQYGPPARTEYRLIVKNLSSRCSWQDLKDFSLAHGEGTYADTHKEWTNEGVIEFRSSSDMRRALDKLYSTDINGRKICLVEDKPRRRRSSSGSCSRSRNRRRSRRRSCRSSGSHSRSDHKSCSQSVKSHSKSQTRSKSHSSTRKSRSNSASHKSRSRSHTRKSRSKVKSERGTRGEHLVVIVVC
ncbi:serine/arginine-rich splicing factor 6-like [Salvelinus namaycush]|uniref:Serine/arginine-rich splicing factor 6-like n=1 Tax=Salvelinus namaycush TaxID=8040 RepID=A0A8U1FAW0_SALNM|nr:serine/arginine-rich splicing factor 6-like [Salvelinus namaycush]